MPSHRPYQFVPVSVPISWRQRLLGGSPLRVFISLVLWAGVITLFVTGWWWVLILFAMFGLVVKRVRRY